MSKLNKKQLEVIDTLANIDYNSNKKHTNTEFILVILKRLGNYDKLFIDAHRYYGDVMANLRYNKQFK